MLIRENEYYVYAHIREDTSELFYIGKGKEGRAFSKSGRNTKWWAIFNTCNIRVLILGFGLTEQQAYELEKEKIQEFRQTIINTVNDNSIKTEIDLDFISKIFYYDETSPTCLRWKIKAGRGRQLKLPGDVAGYIDKSKGYGRAWVNKKSILVHRIIWTLHYSKITDGMDIHHIDGNPSNNKISNLMQVDKIENNSRKPNEWYIRYNRNLKGEISSITLSYLDNDRQRSRKNFQLKRYNNNLDMTMEALLMFRQENRININTTILKD